MIEECRKGDKEALNLFYLRFAPRMHNVVRRYIHDEKDAEDVLHDGFIVGLTRLDSIRDAEKADIWLATIMKNLSLRFLQEQDTATILHEIPEVEEAPELDDFPDLQTLESLIKKLPVGYQKVFRLAILENKSHKEIGRLLGITPSTSSSQLYHAKMMMRKLITDYRLQAGLCFLLLAGLLTGLLIRNHRTPTSDKGEIRITEAQDPKERPTADTITNLSPAPVRQAIAQTPARRRNQLPIPSLEEEKNLSSDHREIPAEETLGISATETVIETADSIPAIDLPPLIAEERPYPYFDPNDNLYEPIIRNTSERGWRFGIGADPAILALSYFGNHELGDFACQDPYPGEDDDQDPDYKHDDYTGKVPERRTGAAGFPPYDRISHTNDLPITAVVTVSKNLNSIFSVESGVRYTYLHSSFFTSTSKAHCHWHYAGIPIKLNTKIHSTSRFRLYAGIGGMVDIPLYSTANVTTKAESPDLRPGRFRSPVSFALSANIGMSIHLFKKIDLFLEPTLQYRFKQDFTVPNYWTDEQWGISMPIGFRFNM